MAKHQKFYLKFWMCDSDPKNQTDVSRPGGRHQDFLDTRWSKTRAQKERPGENISRGKDITNSQSGNHFGNYLQSKNICTTRFVIQIFSLHFQNNVQTFCSTKYLSDQKCSVTAL